MVGVGHALQLDMLTSQRSMWHELRVVLHNRENAMLTVLTQTFTREEQAFADNVLANWVNLGNAIEGMPFE